MIINYVSVHTYMTSQNKTQREREREHLSPKKEICTNLRIMQPFPLLEIFALLAVSLMCFPPNFLLQWKCAFNHRQEVTLAIPMTRP